MIQEFKCRRHFEPYRVSRVRSSLLNLLTLQVANGDPSGAKARECMTAVGMAEAVPFPKHARRM
jgi:hypothetical protein